MTVARNWLQSLWNASYKGTPFFVEKDDESGGRRIVVHQFPMRDDPYLEDLGEDKRDFEVTAYVASDRADTDAGQLVVTCATRGAGILVLPTHGQVLVRCLSFSRDRSKDRHGYIAFSLKFVREGAASALASVAALANLIFIAADNLATAAAVSFVTSFQTGAAATSRASVDFVIEAATSGLRDAVSVLEALRSSEPVEPAVSSAQRDAIQKTFDAIPAMLAQPETVSGAPAAIVGIARALGDGLPSTSAVRAFDEVISTSVSAPLAAVYRTNNLRLAAINASGAARVLRLGALSAYCEGIARVVLVDRPAGITLRANVAEYFEAEVEDLPASEIDLIHAISVMRDAVIDYLSRAILDLAPVVMVEANLSMPSLFWAWRLYQDPSRSSEIVARNRVQHPSLMPPSFEALAR